MPFYVGNVMSAAQECTGVGVIDTSFIDPDIDNDVNAIAVQTDGKIIVGGTFTTVAGTTKNRIARLNNDGTLDTAFNTGGTVGVSGAVERLLIQPDGKIVIAGRFTTARGTTQNRIARLNTNGTLDTGFNTGGTVGANGNIFGLGIQSDGKILVGGIFTTMRGTTVNRLARLNTNGTLDTGFNTGGTIGADDNIRAFIPLDTGKIIVGGDFINIRGTLQNGFARLNSNGTLDTTFNTGANPGVVGPTSIFDMALQEDGKIILVGDFQSFRDTTLSANSPEIARSNDDGTRDTSWTTTPVPNNSVQCCEIQYDGKVFTGGLFVNMRGRAQNYFARLLDDGTDDTTYNVAPNSGVTAPIPGGYVFCSALQDDCKILIGGAFTEVRGSTRHRVARLA